MSPSLLGTTSLDNYIPLNKIPFAPAIGRGVSPPLNTSVLLLCSTEQLLMVHPRGVCSSVMGEMIKASKALDHLEWKVLRKQTPLVLLMLNQENFSCSWFYSSSAFNTTCSLWDRWQVNAVHIRFAGSILQLSWKKPVFHTDDLTHHMLPWNQCCVCRSLKDGWPLSTFQEMEGYNLGHCRHLPWHQKSGKFGMGSVYKLKNRERA